MKVKELFSGRIYTLSNFLSLSRVLLVPFAGYLMHLEKVSGATHYRYWTLALMFVMMSTDFLDGFLARALNQVSRLGQFIDPVADKIASLSMALLLHHYKGLPLWIIGAMVLRDFYAVIGGMLLFSRSDIQVRPNFFGKLMVGCIALTGVLYVLKPPVYFAGRAIEELSLCLIILFLILSSLQYWKTYSKVYFGKER